MKSTQLSFYRICTELTGLSMPLLMIRTTASSKNTLRHMTCFSLINLFIVMANLSWMEVIFFSKKLVILSLPGAAQLLFDFEHRQTLWSVIGRVNFSLPGMHHALYESIPLPDFHLPVPLPEFLLLFQFTFSITDSIKDVWVLLIPRSCRTTSS